MLFTQSREYLLATAMEKRSQSYGHQSNFGVISQVDQQPFLRLFVSVFSSSKVANILSEIKRIHYTTT